MNSLQPSPGLLVAYLLLSCSCALVAQSPTPQGEVFCTDGPIVVTIGGGNDPDADVLEPDDDLDFSDCDNDGIPDIQEVYPDEDIDGDGLPNVCDPDSDDDGVPDGEDNCPIAQGPPENNGCPPVRDERQVFYWHGYQGDAGAWDPVAPYSEGTWELRANQDSYAASAESLQSSAGRAEDQILNIADLQDRPDRNISIAHSMGGLVMRKMGVPTAAGGLEALGGVITVGTPHAGAGPADVLTLYPNRFPNTVAEACRVLVTPLVEESLLDPPFGPPPPAYGGLNFRSNALVAFGLVDRIVDLACGTLPNVVTGLINFVATGIEPELSTAGVVGLAPLSAQHNAAAYGVEEPEGIAARMVGTILSPPNTMPLFSADATDDIGLAAVATVVADYRAGRDRNSSNVICISFPPTGRCLLWQSARRRVAGHYRDALQYLGRLDQIYGNLIGTDRTQSSLAGCDCTEYDHGSTVRTWQAPIPTSGGCGSLNASTGPGTWIQCRERYDISFVTVPSDGFIAARSAMNAPGANYEPFYMEGSNHLQMKNDSQTDRLMDYIFDQGWDASFFRTDRR